MYILNLDERIHFNHGGYVWHGVVTEIHDIGNGKLTYVAKMKDMEIEDYNWYMKTGDQRQEVTVNVDELIH